MALFSPSSKPPRKNCASAAGITAGIERRPVSTKIYEAYRIVEGVDPLNVLWSFKAAGRGLAKTRLAEMYREILDGRTEDRVRRETEIDKLFSSWMREQELTERELTVGGSLDLYVTWKEKVCPPELKVPNDTRCTITRSAILEDLKKAEGPLQVFELDRWVRVRYGEQLTSALRNRWDFDANIAVRSLDERFYLIPYAAENSFLGNTLDFLKDSPLLEDFAYWDNSDRPKRVSTTRWAERRDVWECLIEPARFADFLTLEVVSYGAWHEVSPALDGNFAWGYQP